MVESPSSKRFYHAALNAGLSSRNKAVCRSVCLSVCQMRDLWQNERNLCLHPYTTWKIIHPSFVTRRVVGGGNPFYLKFWVKLTPLERKRGFLIDIRS